MFRCPPWLSWRRRWELPFRICSQSTLGQMSSTGSEGAIASSVEATVALLNTHLRQFMEVAEVAKLTKHTAPTDTKSWSQIIVSSLTGIAGLGRKKGADLIDGSDVKAANLWDAIDTPRFNGVLKTGRLSATSHTPDDVSALDSVPHLFFVLWDYTTDKRPRCRIWVVRCKEDEVFRGIAAKWYADRAANKTSNNFQLHPPRNKDHDSFSNTWGTLSYPLLFAASYDPADKTFKVTAYNPDVLTNGTCIP